jgi:hypothetical protein
VETFVESELSEQGKTLFMEICTKQSHPLRKNLLLRKMKIDPSCSVYGRYDEDGAHLYFKCKIIRQVWRLLDLEEERDMLAGMSSAKKTVEFILSTKNEKRLYLLMTIWMWWGERNTIRTGGSKDLWP